MEPSAWSGVTGPEWVLNRQQAIINIWTNNEQGHVCIYVSPELKELTHFGLVMPYGDMELGQHCLR